MGEIEGTYRALPTPGTRLGSQFNPGISTLETGQSLNSSVAGGKGKCLQIRVQGLDDAQEFYELEAKADGQTLLNDVYRRINLIESDYFGLEFQNVQMNWVWLEPTKLIAKQVRRPMNTLFRLSVKFFPPDPGQLQEEFTRYLFSLQMKRDLMEGLLNCSENTAALLASHLVQSEIGDYDDVADREYLKLTKLLPHQEQLQEKIMEIHRRHVGQTPAESDFQVLEIARKLEMYGVHFHPAADREGTKINLSVAHIGLQVFQGNTKINTFNWSKIRKLSFKRKRFLIKLHPEVHGPHQDTLEFLMASRDQCKIFWKSCVEHHAFFRLFDKPEPKAKAILFSRGSSFRYSGRTQKQLVQYVRDSGVKRTPYQRRNSSKIRMSTRSLATDFPKQSLSFNDSLKICSSPPSATVSFHSLHSSISPVRLDNNSKPQIQQIQHIPSLQQPVRPPTPVKEEPAKIHPPSNSAFPGAPYNPAAGDCSPSFVCVESSFSQNGNDYGDHVALGEGGRGQMHSLGSGAGKSFLTPLEALEVEFMRTGPIPAFPLQFSEEFIDDDPAEMSFYAGGTEAYMFGFNENGETFKYGECEMNGNSNAFSEGAFGRSETSSLVNNRSECSSLDNLGLSSSSLRLPGSEDLSEASSMLNFPPCSARSEASSAMQFSELVDQLEQLSCPPTGTEGSGDGSSDSDSDWGSDGGLMSDQSLFYSNPFTGTADMEAFLLECHNLRALSLGEPPKSTQLDI